jgi:hypothetical protein
MAMNDGAQVVELLARAEALLERAKALKSPDKHPIVRFLNTRRQAMLLQEADAVLEQVGVLLHSPVSDQPRPWWARRRTLLVLQWVTGISNAYATINAVIEGSWVIAAMSAFCLLITTQWIIPRK